jgi:hypothetical protein
MKTNKTRETYIEHCEKKAYSAPSIHEIGLIAEKTKYNAIDQFTDGGDANYDHWKS